MGLSEAGSLWPHWLPPTTPVLSLGAKFGSRPDRNTRKRENIGGSTVTFPGGTHLPGSSPTHACLIPVPQDRSGHSTSHPPESPKAPAPLLGAGCLLYPSHLDVLDPLADTEEADVVEEQHTMALQN